MQPLLIVGAGPVGLTLALELTRFGVPVRIIERSAHQTETSRALVVWSRTLELLDRAGGTDAFLAAGLRAHSTAMRSGKTLLGRPVFDDISSPYNFALMIPQRDTERLLIEHLRTLGVQIERQVELVRFTDRGPDGIEAELAHVDGRRETTLTPWLLGCDGAHSAVRHGVNATFDGSTQNDDWLLADVRLEGAHVPPADEIAIYFHQAGPFAIFPLPGQRARVIATRGKTDDAHPRPEPTLADVQAMIDQRTGGGFSASDPVWLANFRINERKVSQYRFGRAFLLGDAAHIHSPAGGQGMNTGMQDAFNLAWKLALVVQGSAREILLESYSPERSAVGDQVLSNATALTDVATLTNPAAQAARNLAARFLLGLPAVRRGITNTMSETEIAYAHSPLSSGRHAGGRWDPKFYAGSPPGASTTPRFVLYAVDTNEAAAAVVAAKHPALVESTVRRSPDERLYLVRPDGYVGLSAAADAPSEVDRYLAAFT